MKIRSVIVLLFYPFILFPQSVTGEYENSFAKLYLYENEEFIFVNNSDVNDTIRGHYTLGDSLLTIVNNEGVYQEFIIKDSLTLSMHTECMGGESSDVLKNYRKTRSYYPGNEIRFMYKYKYSKRRGYFLNGKSYHFNESGNIIMAYKFRNGRLIKSCLK